MREGLCYDDVLLVPRHSPVKSRANTNLTVVMPKGFVFNHPIVGANMASISGPEFCTWMNGTGGLSLLHRFMPYEKQLEFLNTLTRVQKRSIGLSVGVKREDKLNLESFAAHGLSIVCVDVAHADHVLGLDMVEYIAKRYPHMLIIAGNVATAAGVKRLKNAGADVIKVGVGPGSLCTTRVETGNGVPQLTALMDAYETGECIIADGGIKSPGDCVKALCFSNMVMTGYLFAGCKECPGEVIDGKKAYVGSSTHKSDRIEGVRATVPEKGSASEILKRVIEGIQSGMSYQGVMNLESLRDCPELIRVTANGLRENGARL